MELHRPYLGVWGAGAPQGVKINIYVFSWPKAWYGCGEFIGFGAMDVTKPYEFIGFGAMEGVAKGRLRSASVARTRSVVST